MQEVKIKQFCPQLTFSMFLFFQNLTNRLIKASVYVPWFVGDVSFQLESQVFFFKCNMTEQICFAVK